MTHSETIYSEMTYCGRLTKADSSVEERPFKDRVKHIDRFWASAPVVVSDFD